MKACSDPEFDVLFHEPKKGTFTFEIFEKNPKN